MERIKIIILAAGHGKRMKSELPKVLIPLKGKPLIMHVLEAVKNAGLTSRPMIVVGQKRELVMQTLGDSYDYAIQEEQLGTGHAVMSAKSALADTADHIVVLYGDHPFISADTVKKLIDTQLSGENTITMAAVRLSDFKGWKSVFYQNFSRIVRDEKGNIIKDVQFKDATEEERKITEVNPCYFCFSAAWLWEKLKTLNRDNTQGEYYLTDLIKIAMKEKTRIESINIDAHEALGVNSKDELQVLENFTHA